MPRQLSDGLLFTWTGGSLQIQTATNLLAQEQQLLEMFTLVKVLAAHLQHFIIIFIDFICLKEADKIYIGYHMH